MYTYLSNVSLLLLEDFLKEEIRDSTHKLFVTSPRGQMRYIFNFKCHSNMTRTMFGTLFGRFGPPYHTFSLFILIRQPILHKYVFVVFVVSISEWFMYTLLFSGNRYISTRHLRKLFSVKIWKRPSKKKICSSEICMYKLYIVVVREKDGKSASFVKSCTCVLEKSACFSKRFTTALSKRKVNLSSFSKLATSGLSV